MNISNLTDQEKSVMLVKVLGTEQIAAHAMSYTWYNCGDPDTLEVDFYDSANMALAWRVHLWGLQAGFWTEYYRWWRSPKDRPYIHAAAQCLWLDKILELAIEAGIVELEEEKG